jgi:hypothetical protein
MRKKLPLFDSPEYKRLEEEWYAKAQLSGFIDEENTKRKDRPLKSWHDSKFKNQCPLTKEVTEEYYERAIELLRNHHFETQTQKAIWALHCQGLSEREICGLITTVKKSNMHNIIASLAKKIKGSK